MRLSQSILNLMVVENMKHSLPIHFIIQKKSNITVQKSSKLYLQDKFCHYPFYCSKEGIIRLKRRIRFIENNASHMKFVV